MFRASALSTVLVAATIGFSPPASAICLAPENITGVWHGNDGGQYLMRRAGSRIWWIGDGPGNSWKNVFFGRLNADKTILTGDWADIDPPGSSGTLTIRIHGEIGRGIKQLERIGSTGDGFGGSTWGKRCNDT